MIADHALQDIRALVEQIEAELGPDADPRDVEAIAAQVMARPVEPVLQGTLLISLADCSSRLLSTVRAHAYDKIRRVASHVLPLLEHAASETGLTAGGFDIHTSPVALAAAAAGPSDFIALAADLETAAEQCGADAIHGFAAVAERHVSRSTRAFVESLPVALRSTRRLCASLHCGSIRHGLNVEAVTAASHLFAADIPFARLSLACNAADVVPVGPDAAFSLRLNLVPMISGHPPDLPSDHVATIVEAVANAGRRGAETLHQRSGLDVVFDGIELSGMTQAIVARERATGGIRQAFLRRAVALPTGTSEAALMISAVEELQNEVSTFRPFMVHIFVGGHEGDVIDLGRPFGKQIVRRAEAS
jgi:hypothetical protein